MHKIRRAAVTGLLAVWLAPLPSLGDAIGPDDERNPFLEQAASEDDHARDGWHSVAVDPPVRAVAPEAKGEDL